MINTQWQVAQHSTKQTLKGASLRSPLTVEEPIKLKEGSLV